MIEALVEVNGGARPVVFALSNPKTQAEITSEDAYRWSQGKVVYGSGTAFGPTVLDGKTFTPGQVSSAALHTAVAHPPKYISLSLVRSCRPAVRAPIRSR